MLPILQITGAGKSLDLGAFPRLLKLSRCFGLETARALVGLQVDRRTQARVEELAEKCDEGQLTEEERNEYEAYVQASTLIGILQAKARRLLTETGAA